MFHHNRLKAAIVRLTQGSNQLILTNGLRSEHSSPPRLVLAGPGGNPPAAYQKFTLFVLMSHELGFGQGRTVHRLGLKVVVGIGWVPPFFFS